MYQPERLIDLWAQVVRTALRDYASGYTCPKHPPADVFLRAAGLMDEDGHVRYGGLSPRRKQVTRTTGGSST